MIETATLPNMQEQWQQTLHWRPDAHQQHQFQQLYQHILQGNRQFNLTRITEPMEFWEKHLWDSLRGVSWQENDNSTESDSSNEVPSAFLLQPSAYKLLDIGTGAGFPGIPIAIARPDWQMTLLDSTRKKIEFVKTVLAELQLENVTTVSDRVEQLGQQRLHRASYDLVLIRAVAPASICAEYALPLVKLGGWAILYRGQWTDAETNALQPAVEQLGGTIAHIDNFTTPLTQSVRHCLYLKKVAHTPAEFPRAVGIPTQKPL